MLSTVNPSRGTGRPCDNMANAETDAGSQNRQKRRRLHSNQACTHCRKKKHRCDGEKPECGGCRSRGISCDYPVTSLDRFSVEELEAIVQDIRRRKESSPPPMLGVSGLLPGYVAHRGSSM